VKLDHAGIALELLPDAALWLGDAGTLVVADVHLGKSAAFRARGLAVPEGDLERDLDRLATLVRRHRPARLVIAGDLFHSPAGLTPELRQRLDEWLPALGTSVTLVRGNHDRRLPPLAGLEVVERLALDALEILHDPADANPDTALTIAGHLHPVIRIADGRRSSLRLPCFHLRPQTLVLPAFGSFTGGQPLAPEPGDRLFVAPADQVLEVPPALWR